MALVGLLGHSMATGHLGAKGTQAPGHSVTGHSVAGALGGSIMRGIEGSSPLKMQTTILVCFCALFQVRIILASASTFPNFPVSDGVTLSNMHFASSY